MVGSTTAYAMVMQGVGAEIVMLDQNRDFARAQAWDITHAVPYARPSRVYEGGYEELAGSEVVVVTAGAAQEPGESRMDLLEKNAAVFDQVMPGILEHAPGAVIIVVTNPVDVMTYIAARHAEKAGVDPTRIIGSGTTLDTARFRALVGEKIGVDSRHVHAYVVGEHGDSEVLTWSVATVSGMPLEKFCEKRGVRMDEQVRAQVDNSVRKAAYAIIEGKGATYYGIGSAVAYLADAILNDRRTVTTVSVAPGQAGPGELACVSLPRLVTGNGVSATFVQPLSREEQAALEDSANKVWGTIRELEKKMP